MTTIQHNPFDAMGQAIARTAARPAVRRSDVTGSPVSEPKMR